MGVHPGEIGRAPTLAGALRLLASAGLPASDLTEAHLPAFFYIGTAEAPDARVGMELHGPDALPDHWSWHPRCASPASASSWSRTRNNTRVNAE